MVSHPRLAYDQTHRALLVAAINLDNQLIYMNRLLGDTWQQPVIISNPTTRVDINVGSQTIRMAYGFSFDVGSPSQTELENGNIRVNDDAIRLLYTTRDARTQRIYVRGSACRADLANCHDVPQWGTTPGNLNTPRDQWNPTVAAWPDPSGCRRFGKPRTRPRMTIPTGLALKKGTWPCFPTVRRRSSRLIWYVRARHLPGFPIRVARTREVRLLGSSR
jgi:hypothetical protein